MYSKFRRQQREPVQVVINDCVTMYDVEGYLLTIEMTIR